MVMHFIDADPFSYPERKERDGLHVSEIAKNPQENRIGLKSVFQATFNSRTGMPEAREEMVALPAPPVRRRRKR